MGAETAAGDVRLLGGSLLAMGLPGDGDRRATTADDDLARHCRCSAFAAGGSRCWTCARLAGAGARGGRVVMEVAPLRLPFFLLVELPRGVLALAPGAPPLRLPRGLPALALVAPSFRLPRGLPALALVAPPLRLPRGLPALALVAPPLRLLVSSRLLPGAGWLRRQSAIRCVLRVLRPLLRRRVGANCACLSVLQEPGVAERRVLSLGVDDTDSAHLAGELDEEGGLVDGARTVSAKGRESQAWRGQAMKLTAEPSRSSEFRSMFRRSPGVVTRSHRTGGRVVESTWYHVCSCRAASGAWCGDSNSESPVSTPAIRGGLQQPHHVEVRSERSASSVRRWQPPECFGHS